MLDCVDTGCMEPARNWNPFTFEPRESSERDERRRHGRLRCEDLRCSVGQIRDLSASGMQVFHKGGEIAAVGDELQIMLEHLDAAMQVDVRIARVDKLGFRKRLYGFEFVRLTDEKKARLTALARLAADMRTLARS